MPQRCLTWRPSLLKQFDWNSHQTCSCLLLFARINNGFPSWQLMELSGLLNLKITEQGVKFQSARLQTKWEQSENQLALENAPVWLPWYERILVDCRNSKRRQTCFMCVIKGSMFNPLPVGLWLTQPNCVFLTCERFSFKWWYSNA